MVYTGDRTLPGSVQKLRNSDSFFVNRKRNFMKNCDAVHIFFKAFVCSMCLEF